MNLYRDRNTQELNEEVADLKNTKDLEMFLRQGEVSNILFAKQLKQYMDEKNVTAKELSARTCISESHIHNLSNGNRVPGKRQQVIAIGAALKLSVKEINELLKDAGFNTLDAKRSVGDAVVIFGREKLRDMDDIDQMMRSKQAEYYLLPDMKD